MPKNIVEYPTFGQDHYSYIDAAKYYSDIKGAYDAFVSSYNRASYTVRPLPGSGTVPLRNQYKFHSEIFNQAPTFNDALSLIFYVPLKKEFQMEVEATLTSWVDGTLLAKNSGAATFRGFNHADNINISNVGNNDDLYGFMYLNLMEDAPNAVEDGLELPLQHKLKSWVDKGKPMTQRLFSLTVRKMAWTWDKAKHDLTPEEFEVRQDTIILEFLDQ